MTRLLSLAHLSAVDLTPPELVRAAARHGFDAVGLRLLRVTETTPGYPLWESAEMLAETQTAQKETGIQVFDAEFVRITPEFDPAALLPFLDTAAALGAQHVIAAPYDEERPRLIESLATLQELARARGMNAVLEFYPWTCVPDLATVVEVVDAAGEDVGILVDTLHFDRSKSDLDLLSRIDPRRLPYLHLADAHRQPSYTLDELLLAGRAERLPPGEGEIDLKAIISRMPPECPIAIEIPMSGRLAREGADAVLSRLKTAADKLLAEA